MAGALTLVSAWGCDSGARGEAGGPAPTPPGAESCAAADFTIARFPLNGVSGRDWMINSYVDLDPTSPGIRDYQDNAGARARTYDGHRGIDIDIPSFREMDSDTAVVHAVTAGTVDQVIQDQPDRNTRCTGDWNLVRVRHANGFHIFYGHIKRDSARVTVGQVIAVGTPLAIAGSAGCSTQPHLHLEVQDCAHAPIDTLLPPALWINAPAYDASSSIMDVMLSVGSAPTLARIKDPAPNPSRLTAGTRTHTLGLGLSAALRGGDHIAVTLIDPNGDSSTQSLIVDGPARLGHRYVSLAFSLRGRGAAGGGAIRAPLAPTGPVAGTWTIEALINDALADRRTIAQDPPEVDDARRPGVSGRPAHPARAHRRPLPAPHATTPSAPRRAPARTAGPGSGSARARPPKKNSPIIGRVLPLSAGRTPLVLRKPPFANCFEACARSRRRRVRAGIGQG